MLFFHQDMDLNIAHVLSSFASKKDRQFRFVIAINTLMYLFLIQPFRSHNSIGIRQFDTFVGYSPKTISALKIYM